MESVARQAELRSQSRIVDLATYFPIRRHTSGAPSTIAWYEIDLNIPDEIRYHRVIVEMETIAVDLIVIANVSLSLLTSLYSSPLACLSCLAWEV